MDGAYNNWATNEPNGQSCVLYRDDHEWEAASCSAPTGWLIVEVHAVLIYMLKTMTVNFVLSYFVQLATLV